MWTCGYLPQKAQIQLSDVSICSRKMATFFTLHKHLNTVHEDEFLQASPDTESINLVQKVIIVKKSIIVIIKVNKLDQRLAILIH